MSERGCRLIAENAAEISVASAKEAQQVAGILQAEGKWREVVPGLASVTVLFDPSQTGSDEVIASLIQAASRDMAGLGSTISPLKVPIQYGGEYGPDLSMVCETLGVRQTEFIAAHIAASHEVAMMGFTPGFAYVEGVDAEMNVPRLGAPRPRLPAGSIGISSGYTGIYSLAGPGGWPIIGRTEMVLFDRAADDPFLFEPGQRLIFEAV